MLSRDTTQPHLTQRLPRGALRAVWLLLAMALGGCATQTADPGQSSGNYLWQRGDPEQGQADRHALPEGVEPTVVAFRDYRDPLIHLNRAIFGFNDLSYRYALIPLSNGYVNVVPSPVRRSVTNFFYNLKSPIYLVNNLLQVKPREAGTNVARFSINTTLGLLGLFDPAKDWFEIDKAQADFEGTLAQYGAGYGVYLVLPLIGPSDLRNGASALTEGYLHPVSYLADNPERLMIQGFDNFQEFAPQADIYKDLAEQSEDPYIFFRNLYLQGVQRDAKYD